MEMLIGVIMAWGFIPLGLGVGLSFWAGGNRFPVALLKAIGAMVVFLFLGMYLVDDASSEYRASVDRANQTTNAGPDEVKESYGIR
jgi:hypothetical protein